MERFKTIGMAAAMLLFALKPPAIAFSAQQPTPEQVRDYVGSQAILRGLDETAVLFIVGRESQFGSRMRGDDGQSRGYWMISRRWHPEVSDACADDLKCSTAWSLERIKAGHIREWSTWRLRCRWYTDAPEC